MKLSELKAGLAVTGIEGDVVTIISALIPLSSTSVQVIYKLPDGSLKERMLDNKSAELIALASAARPWSFTGEKLRIPARIFERLEKGFDERVVIAHSGA